MTSHGLLVLCQLEIVSHGPTGGETGNVDLSDVDDQIAQSESSLRELNTGLQNSLTKSGNQKITG